MTSTCVWAICPPGRVCPHGQGRQLWMGVCHGHILVKGSFTTKFITKKPSQGLLVSKICCVDCYNKWDGFLIYSLHFILCHILWQAINVFDVLDTLLPLDFLNFHYQEHFCMTWIKMACKCASSFHWSKIAKSLNS